VNSVIQAIDSQGQTKTIDFGWFNYEEL